MISSSFIVDLSLITHRVYLAVIHEHYLSVFDESIEIHGTLIEMVESGLKLALFDSDRWTCGSPGPNEWTHCARVPVLTCARHGRVSHTVQMG